ncbi:transcriptional regulator [Acetivibrio sp. MSJd-27]|uniref:type II restriction enzyme n=1 Tax=Acetivibrio sp. MSJd-27 TaxID=2841523 RepID=UPI0020A206B2|nr:transcriptional regulator [Acetivibrio sp. MSJd-27]
MSSGQKGKNDVAWEALFEKYDILSRIDETGAFAISADQIREFREPRLMAKFDHKINLPRIFTANGLSILPVSRGDYVISHFQAYHPFEPSEKKVEKASLPPHLQSLNPNRIPSEAIALNCALASGILADFLEEKSLYSTVSGRMGSETFSFDIFHTRKQENINLTVKNAQIEIDAAVEGLESLALIEAKRDISEDFLVRQLYYPYRAWRERISKRIRPVFLVYSNGIFSLYEYQFYHPLEYHSLRLIRQKNYTIEDTLIRREDLVSLVMHTVPEPEPEIAFPQADSLERVINLCELLSDRPMSREEVTQEYAFDIRQTNYYTDAGRYLGFIEKDYGQGHKPYYQLTAAGAGLMKLPYCQRQLGIVQALLRHKVFRDGMRIWLQCGELPGRKRVIELMKRADLYHVESESTFYRRASTVTSWLQWTAGLLEN